jgi:hypothetical protein
MSYPRSSPPWSAQVQPLPVSENLFCSVAFLPPISGRIKATAGSMLNPSIAETLRKVVSSGNPVTGSRRSTYLSQLHSTSCAYRPYERQRPGGIIDAVHRDGIVTVVRHIGELTGGI